MACGLIDSTYSPSTGEWYLRKDGHGIILTHFLPSYLICLSLPCRRGVVGLFWLLCYLDFLSYLYSFMLVTGWTGKMQSSKDVYETNARIKSGDEVIMELDLRRPDPQKRTLHFFIRRLQQYYYFDSLPQNVKFGVCIHFYYNTQFLCSIPLLSFSVQLSLHSPSCGTDIFGRMD